MTNHPKSLLRPLAVVALLVGLTGCTASVEAASAPDDAPDESTATTGGARTGPVVVGAHEYEPILEGTFPVPGSDAGDQVTVGLVTVVDSGQATELRVVLTPAYEDDGARITIFRMLDSHVQPELWDVGSLRSYHVLTDTGQSFRTDPTAARTHNGQPVLFQAFFPPLKDRPDAIDVVVHPSWPVFEDVPVTYED